MQEVITGLLKSKPPYYNKALTSSDDFTVLSSFKKLEKGIFIAPGTAPYSKDGVGLGSQIL